ncbi:unnamed protein product [Hymenolepis diminuta]|uniref:sn-1-specific diacylglycerol lipase n=1 Tax=Hymenolepis diminuta TaxID=6216 RepID=A0A0R3SGV3_HYMDI|nr:unnamed protein product [Hymenolepis diminuta]
MILEVVFCSLSIWQIDSLFNSPDKGVNFSAFVSVITWCSILLFAIVFEWIDWIRHYDEHGRIKYQFYQTFLHKEESWMDDEEKRELVHKIREIKHFHWQEVLTEKFASSKNEDIDDDKIEAISAVASALTDLLIDLDLTSSDLIVALILLRWQSDQWIDEQGLVPVKNVLKETDPDLTNVAAPLDPSAKNPIDKLEKNWMHISRLHRYSQLVNASYGWTYYICESPCNCIAINRLCKRLSWKNPPAPDKQIDLENGIKGPGGCLCAGNNCYLSAFLEMSQLKTEDILAFEITDKFYEAAMMLVIDDITEAIVLIVRGTLSDNDTLVDLIAAGEPLRDEDRHLPPDEQLIAHSGMGRTAKNIVTHLLEDQWIEAAKKLRPTYPLVITGHSLGAGLVSLMCALLKPHYPELKAYAFSPPNGLMNKKLAMFTRDYLISVTYGYDCVGRMSAQTLEDLRARIFHALCVYKTPKFLVLGRQFCLTIIRKLFCATTLRRLIKINKEVQDKLIDPDMNDAFETRIGSKFKPFLADRFAGAAKVDRLLSTPRSLMKWKRPNCRNLLVLPRPYPRDFYPEHVLSPDGQHFYSIDFIVETTLHNVLSGHLLHILEVDKEFEIPGVKPYNKRGYEPPPIAVWADPDTFNSLLVHPKMFFNHSPVKVATVLERLYNAIMNPEKIYHKIHANTYHKENKPVQAIERKLTESDKEKYCLVRKFK